MALEREHPAASLTWIEHQPSKLRVAGSRAVCRVLPIAPSTYYATPLGALIPKRPARSRSDAALAVEIGASSRRTSAARRPEGLAPTRPGGDQRLPAARWRA